MPSLIIQPFVWNNIQYYIGCSFNPMKFTNHVYLSTSALIEAYPNYAAAPVLASTQAYAEMNGFFIQFGGLGVIEFGLLDIIYRGVPVPPDSVVQAVMTPGVSPEFGTNNIAQ